MDFLHDRLGVFERAGAGNDGQDQAVFGVVSDMVPPVTLVVVGGIGGVAVVLLLGDERPLFVELNFAGLGGKGPRVPRERREHVNQPSVPVA